MNNERIFYTPYLLRLNIEIEKKDLKLYNFDFYISKQNILTIVFKFKLIWRRREVFGNVQGGLVI